MAFSQGLRAYLVLSLSFFIYLHFYHAAPEPRQRRGCGRQVHYMSQEFKVILRLLCLLSGAPASLRYSNARSRTAKSSPISVRGSACGATAAM